MADSKFIQIEQFTERGANVKWLHGDQAHLLSGLTTLPSYNNDVDYERVLAEHGRFHSEVEARERRAETEEDVERESKSSDMDDQDKTPEIEREITRAFAKATK